MHAGAGGFAGGVEAGERGAAAEIGADAAHEVVRGGADGDQVAAQVETVLREEGADAGEARDEVDVLHVAHVEVDGTERGLRIEGIGEAFAGYGAGDDVAWGELEKRMVALHEALAALVAQVRALAAQGFGDEEARGVRERQRRGMELVKLHVGEFGTG